MSQNNNKSRAAINLQASWASSISDYILLRREQTCTAYQAIESLNEGARKSSDNKEESGLFAAFFTMLAIQLEEGHTVLTIEAVANEIPMQGEINGEQVTLYLWQQQLLEILATPILALIDNQFGKHPEGDVRVKSSLFVLLDTMLTKREQLWAPLSLSNHEKDKIRKRFDSVVACYQWFRNKDLNAFIQKIHEHDLFTDVHANVDNINPKNSLSKNNQPIIYQLSCIESIDHSAQSITFWLHRAWQAEFNLAQHIHHILAQQIAPLQITMPKTLKEQQIVAINIANKNAFSIITGGPGTGKTYTVAQLVIALQQAAERGSDEHKQIRFSTDSASLALAAPTGKAAQRMQESLQAALDAANVNLQLQEAKTIHRLLGIGRTGRPRYDAKNPLGEDIIIVDEASMLGVEMANYLVSAIKPGARLILLGDANQLAAVDAGAVLADLCRIPTLQTIHARLIESQRFSADSGIGKLAHLINQKESDIDAIWELVKQDESLHFESVNGTQAESFQLNKTINSLSNIKIFKEMSFEYTNFLEQVKKLLEHPIEKSMPDLIKSTIASLMDTFNQFRVLSAGHNGEWGDHSINNYLTQWHLAELKLPLGQNTWFHGRPVMVLQNNYELGLFNGDIGFCLQTTDDRNRLEVFFENKTQGIAVNLLNEEVIATAYAMTIHKSQGSEFEHVAITFDNSHARLLSKELIYTAVTRAKKQVTIYSTKQALETAVKTPTERHTGLALQFSKLQ